jgi:hypothetical protein
VLVIVIEHGVRVVDSNLDDSTPKRPIIRFRPSGVINRGDSAEPSTVRSLSDQRLQRIPIRLHGQVVVGQVVDRGNAVVGLEDEDIAPGDLPAPPHIRSRRILQPGKRLSDEGVSALLPDGIDAENAEGSNGRLRRDLCLNLF